VVKAHSRRASYRLVGTVGVAGLVLGLAGPVLAASGGGGGGGKVTDAGSQAAELMTSMSQRDAVRTAPTGQVAPGAYYDAWARFAALPSATRSWADITNVPYNADDPRYRDPSASNSGGGAGYVTGRIEAVVVDAKCIFAGGGMGGVFRSCNNGKNWTPIADALSTQSVGYLALAPDGALWLATGDGNTGGSTYVGSGVYRLASPDSAAFATSDKVGSTELDSQIIRKLLIDGPNHEVFVAGSRGLYMHSLLASAKATPWTRVLVPCATAAGGCPDVNPNYWDIANDVVVQPGTKGQVILANLAWRNGASYNGFYLSKDGGTKWAKINPLGAINPKSIGNATMAYSADGSKLYVMIEDPTALLSGAASALGGIYVSGNGAAVGPYAQIANPSVLSQSGSAMRKQLIGKGYQPGVQAWYNQFLGVDPHNPMHVYAGLEEVYESWNGGQTWSAIGRYWNFGFPCWSYLDANNICNGNVLHSDQHSIAFSSDGKTVYVGNDGGLYSRAVSPSANSWTSLSRSGQLDALQYYSVGVGRDVQAGAPAGSVQVWGGLQDNGVSLLDPVNGATMVSPFGGDGGMQLVDPNNGCRTVGEYVDLTLQMTTNCGVADGAPATDNSIITIAPADPNPRFIAPFSADLTNPNLWVAGGEDVWTNSKTWASTSGADWINQYDSGAGHSITAIVSSGGTVWAGWCGSCNPGGAFHRGVLTNAGGGYGQVAIAGEVPNRMITGVNPVPGDPTSAYVTFGGYSRNWTDGPGAALSGHGHLWKVTLTGGADLTGHLNATWTDVSGNLPDIPADNLLITGSTPDSAVLLGTDLGMVETTLGDLQGTPPVVWLRDSLPATVVSQVILGPDNNLYAATYGRGIWRAAA
jgi:hypothetical protein